MEACRSGDLDRIRLALTENVALTQRGAGGETLLHWAAEGGQTEIVNFLITEQGFDVNCPDYENSTPLHWSVQEENHLDCTKFLIEKGAKINAKDDLGETPLHMACFAGIVDSVSLLAEKGADINAIDGAGYTPLHAAILNSRKDCVLVLIGKGAKCDIPDKNGKTPKHLAYENQAVFPKTDFLFESKQDLMQIVQQTHKEMETLRAEKDFILKELNDLKEILQQNESHRKYTEKLGGVFKNLEFIEQLLSNCANSVKDAKQIVQIEL